MLAAQEAKENAISLNEDDPEAVNAVLQYLYQETYDVESRKMETNPMILHVRIFALSEKFMIEGLRMVAATKLAAAVKSGWKTVNPFSDAIVEAYNTVQEIELLFTNALADALCENSVLFHDEKYAEFVKATSKAPGFAMAVAKLFSRNQGEQISGILRCRIARCRGALVYTGHLGNGQSQFSCSSCSALSVFITAKNKFLG